MFCRPKSMHACGDMDKHISATSRRNHHHHTTHNTHHNHPQQPPTTTTHNNHPQPQPPTTTHNNLKTALHIGAGPGVMSTGHGSHDEVHPLPRMDNHTRHVARQNDHHHNHDHDHDHHHFRAFWLKGYPSVGHLSTVFECTILQSLLHRLFHSLSKRCAVHVSLQLCCEIRCRWMSSLSLVFGLLCAVVQHRWPKRSFSLLNPRSFGCSQW